ncbi:MAG TPA: hypothetical protein DCX08_06315, partial [Porticoccaceae bacterium]|nr:hypothetical protein [Porticoccaceae bacterium]
MTNGDDAVRVKKWGRLQRPMSSSGSFVTSFFQVLQRHGGLMSVVAAILLLIPGSIEVLLQLIIPFQSAPNHYLWASFLILCFFLLYWVFNYRKVNMEQLVWA